MTDTAMTTAVLDPAEPDGAPRLAVLDILRGVAILGILFMNINDMGGTLQGSGLDPRLLGWTAIDRVAWWVREILADGTARGLLEMLFGVGMVILTDRAAARMAGRRLLRGYTLRNVVLFLFGLIHLFVLLWPGDILHTYAIAALVAVWFRRLRPRLLLTIGLIGAAAQLVFVSTYVYSATQARTTALTLQARAAAGRALDPGERAAIATWRKDEADAARNRAGVYAEVARENAQRTGTGRSWAAAAWFAIIVFEQRFTELFVVWEAAGTMLIGAALYRWGIIQGQHSARFYAGTMAASYLLGCGLRIWLAWAITRFDHQPSEAFAFGEFARLATTLGHLCLVNLLLKTVAGARLLRPFAAAGRTALSVYIAQTLLCLWVIYPPWGLRLYGRQGWTSLLATAAALDLVLLVLANLWVRRFAIAPVEWAWRSILIGRRLSFRDRDGRRVRAWATG